MSFNLNGESRKSTLCCRCTAPATSWSHVLEKLLPNPGAYSIRNPIHKTACRWEVTFIEVLKIFPFRPFLTM